VKFKIVAQSHLRYILKEFEDGSMVMEITYEKQFEWFNFKHELSASEMKKFKAKGKVFADQLHQKLSPIY